MTLTNYTENSYLDKTKALIFELSKNLNFLSSSEEVLKFCVREFIPHFNLTDFVIYKYSAQSKSLSKCATLNQFFFDHNDKREQLTLSLGSGIVGQTAIKKSSYLVNNTEKDQNYIVDEVRRYSELCTPIVFKNKLVGVMDSEHEEKGFYNMELKQVFETLSLIIAPYLKEISLRQSESNHLSRFRSMMEDDRVYLDKDLSLESIADQLSITPGHLSTLIHQQGLESFRMFVNKYRINHFLKLSKSESIVSQSILSMAFSSGFSSKATFNRIFKKQMGISPIKYLKEYSC